MPLQTRLSGLIMAIGTDIKALQTALVSVAKTGVNDAGLARGSFFIYSVNATLIPNNANTIVPLPGVVFDVSGGSNGTGFVVPVTGIYRVTGHWRGTGLVTGAMVYPAVSRNGTYVLNTVYYISGPDQSFMTAGLVYCNAGDILRLEVYQNTGGTRNTISGTNQTYLCGELVGRTT